VKFREPSRISFRNEKKIFQKKVDEACLAGLELTFNLQLDYSE